MLGEMRALECPDNRPQRTQERSGDAMRLCGVIDWPGTSSGSCFVSSAARGICSSISGVCF